MTQASLLQAEIERSRLRRRLPDPATCRALRERVHISQSALGRALDVSAAAISRWESGTREPRDQFLERYLDALEQLAREAV